MYVLYEAKVQQVAQLYHKTQRNNLVINILGRYVCSLDWSGRWSCGQQIPHSVIHINTKEPDS